MQFRSLLDLAGVHLLDVVGGEEAVVAVGPQALPPAGVDLVDVSDYLGNDKVLVESIIQEIKHVLSVMYCSFSGWNFQKDALTFRDV